MTKHKTNPKVDKYLSQAEQWQQEMEALRTILLDCRLGEELKWDKPCYTFEESNVIVIQGFKKYCALLFMKGVLIDDNKGVLVKTGENTIVGRQIRFTSVAEIEKLKPRVKAYVQKAIEVEKAGLKVETQAHAEIKFPEELQNAFSKNAALEKAFAALTPGRQRAYIFYFSAAKQSETRDTRIKKCTPQILKGIGLNER